MCPQVQATTTYPRAFEIRSNPLRDLRLCRVRLIVRLEIRFVHSHFLDFPCFRCFRSRRVLCEIQKNWSETKEVYTAAQHAKQVDRSNRLSCRLTRVLDLNRNSCAVERAPASSHSIHAPSSTTAAKLESPTRYTLPSLDVTRLCQHTTSTSATASVSAAADCSNPAPDNRRCRLADNHGCRQRHRCSSCSRCSRLRKRNAFRP